MKKIVRSGESVIVVLDDGTILQNDSCSDELFDKLKASTVDSEIAMLLLPNLKEAIKACEEASTLLSRVSKSKLLSLEGSSVYWDDISELSMPQNFVEKILDAEDNNDVDAIEAYKNFWTLLCLNPDERVRQNLFWYLDNWGMRISKTGMFVGYRNVDIFEEGKGVHYTKELCDFVVESYEEVRNAKKSTGDYWVLCKDGGYHLMSSTSVLTSNVEYEDKYNLRDIYNELKAVNFKSALVGDDTVFTDHHSGTFRIKIGEMVTMPREKCDCDSNVECSRGLIV